MTCAELLDTLLDHRLELTIATQPGKDEVMFTFQRMDQGQRYASRAFLHKSRLEDCEDQQHKEALFEQVIESVTSQLTRKP